MYIYTVCVRPIVSRYNGDVFAIGKSMEEESLARSTNKNIYKISNEIIIEIHNMISD